MHDGIRTASRVTRRSFVATSALAVAGALGPWGAAPARAQKLEKLTFGTNWKAQAEHGGYYQAVATGIYKKAGLDVTIRMGGPQINHPQLLAAGAIDFNMGSNCFSALNYVKNNIPMVLCGHRLPEGSAGADHPRRPGQRLAGGAEGQADHDLAGGARRLLAVPPGQVRLHRRPDPDIHVQHGAVPGRQVGHPAGLRDERAIQDREGRRQDRRASCWPTAATRATPPRSRRRGSSSTRSPTSCSAS